MNTDQPELPAEVRDVAEKVIDAYHTAGSHENGILRGATALAPLWPKQPQPSADVEKLAEEIGKVVIGPMFSWEKREAVNAILARAFAEKGAEIARLKDKHQQSPEYLSMLQAMLDMKARAERAEAELAEQTQTLSLVYAANERAVEAWRAAHPEESEILPDHKKMVEWLLAERDRLRDALAADDMVPKAVGDELIQLRAEVEQWKTTAAKDREENVDMRNEIADLRGQLAAAQEDSKIVDCLASMWDSQGKGHHICGWFVPNVTGSFRSAVLAHKALLDSAPQGGTP